MIRRSLRQLERFDNWLYPTGGRRVAIAIAVLAMIAGSAWLVSATGDHRFVYSHTMYVPILAAALFFRKRGGITAGILAGLVLGPLMPSAVAAGGIQLSVNWVYRMAVFVLVGGLAGAAVSVMDQYLRQFKWLAYHSPATGLPSATSLDAMLQRMIAGGDGKTEVHVIAFRVNNYVKISSTFGSVATETLARELAARLSEFVHAPLCELLPNTLGTATSSVMLRDPQEVQTLLEASRQPVDIGDLHVFPDVCIGFASYPLHGSHPGALIRKASHAAYQAGANSMSVLQYSEIMELRDREGCERVGMLPDALNSGELSFHYQPIVAMADGQPAFVEALIRWNSPQLGYVAPADFVPRMENTSLVYPVHDYTVRETLSSFSSWSRSYPGLRLSINLSVRLLRDSSWLHLAETLVREHGLKPRHILFEITESALMADFDASLRTLDRVRELGMGLAVDDFGTGFSSLGYLKRLPVEHLKIDQSFIANVISDPNDQQIVRATISLAHNLGLEVVAEGVETQDAYEWLAENGCDYAQGFWICRPSPPDEVQRWLEGRKQMGQSMDAT